MSTTVWWTVHRAGIDEEHHANPGRQVCPAARQRPALTSCSGCRPGCRWRTCRCDPSRGCTFCWQDLGSCWDRCIRCSLHGGSSDCSQNPTPSTCCRQEGRKGEGETPGKVHFARLAVDGSISGAMPLVTCTGCASRAMHSALHRGQHTLLACTPGTCPWRHHGTPARGLRKRTTPHPAPSTAFAGMPGSAPGFWRRRVRTAHLHTVQESRNTSKVAFSAHRAITISRCRGQSQRRHRSSSAGSCSTLLSPCCAPTFALDAFSPMPIQRDAASLVLAAVDARAHKDGR